MSKPSESTETNITYIHLIFAYSIIATVSQILQKFNSNCSPLIPNQLNNKLPPLLLTNARRQPLNKLMINVVLHWYVDLDFHWLQHTCMLLGINTHSILQSSKVPLTAIANLKVQQSNKKEK
jgi:hypothetical protein